MFLDSIFCVYLKGGLGHFLCRLKANSPRAPVFMATALSALTPVKHDNRYFVQTGFRIDNAQIWDYFRTRGGVDTFGYPVSGIFLLQGFPVHLFQRHVLQIWPDGSVHPLNLLDPDLLPVTSVNYSTFPAYNPVVAQAAPQPKTPNYAQAVQAYLQSSVPDRWQGQPVNFLHFYLSAAPEEMGSLQALMALEVWGFPTSQPMTDPHNPSFISQRFQRGIMQYNTVTGVTRSILVGDVFKDVLVGHGPADLLQEMQGSRFYQQSDPNAPIQVFIPTKNGLERYPVRVRNPRLLPNTDFDNAFTPNRPTY